jgi:hypothetical protein
MGIAKFTLTAYLVRKICGNEESVEDLLGEITVLPWFRRGRMPDWLRVRLITALESRDEVRIRHLIEDLLLSALDPMVNPQSIFQIAREDRSFRSRIMKTLFRPEFHREANARSIAEPFREHVFATFMRNPLAFRLPQPVRRLIDTRNWQPGSARTGPAARLLEGISSIAIGRGDAPEKLHTAMLVRAIIASTVGTSIGWYDFFLYSTVTGLVFAKEFFPRSAPLVGTLQAFLIYAVGFVARPA